MNLAVEGKLTLTPVEMQTKMRVEVRCRIPGCVYANEQSQLANGAEPIDLAIVLYSRVFYRICRFAKHASRPTVSDPGYGIICDFSLARLRQVRSPRVG